MDHGADLCIVQHELETLQQDPQREMDLLRQKQVEQDAAMKLRQVSIWLPFVAMWGPKDGHRNN